MKKFAIALPRLNETDLLTETIESVRASSLLPDQIILVDNGDEPLSVLPSGSWGLHYVRPPRLQNRGFDVQSTSVAASWNIAFRKTSLPVVLLNSDCAVARKTFEEMMNDPARVVCAYYFACARVDHEVWQEVGPFDEDFYPAYYEDTDYRRRLNLCGVSISDWAVEPFTVVSVGRTRSVREITHGKEKPCWSGDKLAWFHDRIEECKQRYVAKWGGMPGRETFATPFDGFVSSGAG